MSTQAPATRRINRGNGHSYVLDGQPVIGVTTVVGAMNKPGLIGWAASEVARHVVSNPAEVQRLVDDYGSDAAVKTLAAVPNANRDRKAQRGTQVHALAEQLADGKEVDVPDELAGYVGSVVRFLDEWQASPVLSEVSVFSRAHGYGGTLDGIVDWKHPQLTGRWLIDYKTASDVYGDTALQLAAYRFADFYLAADGTEMPMPDVDGCAVVHVREDGYSVVPMVADEDTFGLFCHLLVVARDMATNDRAWRDHLPHPRILGRYTA